MLPFKNTLFELFGAAIDSSNYSSLNIVGVEGFHELLNSKGILSTSDIIHIVQCLNKIILEKFQEESSASALSVLSSYCESHPELILEYSVSPFLNGLVDFSQTKFVVNILSVVIELSKSNLIFRSVMPHLFSKIHSSYFTFIFMFRMRSNMKYLKSDTFDFNIVKPVLSSMLLILQTRFDNKKIYDQDIFDIIIFPLLDKFQILCRNPSDDSSHDSELLYIISSMFIIITRMVDSRFEWIYSMIRS